jgi:hypothetical protein
VSGPVVDRCTTEISSGGALEYNGREITETWINNGSVHDNIHRRSFDASGFCSIWVCQDNIEFNIRENCCVYLDRDYLHYSKIFLG